MKKIFSFILAGVLILSLTACNGAELDEKQAEIDALKTQVTTLETEKEQLEDQVDTLSTLVSVANRDANDLQETIDSNVKVIQDLAGEISDKNSEIGDIEDVVEALEEELALAEEALATAGGNTETQAIIIESLQTTIVELNAEKTSLETEVADLGALVTALEATVVTNSAAIANLEAEKAILFEALHEEVNDDNLIIVSYEDYYGDARNAVVGYDDDYEGTLFDLLIQEFDVTYSDTEYGRMLNGFEHLQPLTGSYIAFYQNNAMSWVGLDDATFVDGDHIHFEISYWDAREQAVDDAIQLFLDNHAANYVNATTVDYNVITALNILGLTEDYVTQTEVEAIIGGLTLSTTADYFKAVASLNAVGSNDAIDLVEAFAPTATTGAWGQTAYALTLLNSVSTTADFTQFETDALDYLKVNTPYDAGLDTGGVDLVALAKYAEDTEVQALIDAYTAWIQADQIDNGGVMTRDMGWGSNLNAASTAQIIIALIANGENPVGMDYTSTLGNTLIDALLMHQTATGSFDWDLDQAPEEDLMFSTPQAFLALVMYQTYSNNGNTALQPFDAE